MNKSRFYRLSFKGHAAVCVIVLVLGIVSARWLASAQAVPKKTPIEDHAALLEAFRHVEVASVSDALEQITGQRMYMTHRMQPIFPSKFAGFAVTVLLKKAEANNDPAALNGMLAAIDQGQADSVYVMVVEDGANIAGMGGLMGTTMAARGFAGARPAKFQRDSGADFVTAKSGQRCR